MAGLLLGGFWVGAAGFVATSYLAKKESFEGWVSLIFRLLWTLGVQEFRFAVSVCSKAFELRIHGFCVEGRARFSQPQACVGLELCRSHGWMCRFCHERTEYRQI